MGVPVDEPLGGSLRITVIELEMEFGKPNYKTSAVTMPLGGCHCLHVDENAATIGFMQMQFANTLDTLNQQAAEINNIKAGAQMAPVRCAPSASCNAGPFSMAPAPSPMTWREQNLAGFPTHDACNQAAFAAQTAANSSPISPAPGGGPDGGCCGGITASGIPRCHCHHVDCLMTAVALMDDRITEAERRPAPLVGATADTVPDHCRVPLLPSMRDATPSTMPNAGHHHHHAAGTSGGNGMPNCGAPGGYGPGGVGGPGGPGGPNGFGGYNPMTQMTID